MAHFYYKHVKMKFPRHFHLFQTSFKSSKPDYMDLLEQKFNLIFLDARFYIEHTFITLPWIVHVNNYIT